MGHNLLKWFLVYVCFIYNFIDFQLSLNLIAIYATNLYANYLNINFLAGILQA